MVQVGSTTIQQQHGIEIEKAQLAWTSQLVSNVEKKIKIAKQAEELKKLTLDFGHRDYHKMIQEYLCPICTNVVEDMVMCGSCEGLMCQTCIQYWQNKSTDCPLCRENYVEVRIPKKVRNLLNQCEFHCPYDCGETFIYEHRKTHYNECVECSKSTQKCPFCAINMNQIQGDLSSHAKGECEGEELMCQHCNLNVYQMYYDLESLKQNRGHICKRDLKQLMQDSQRLR